MLVYRDLLCTMPPISLACYITSWPRKHDGVISFWNLLDACLHGFSFPRAKFGENVRSVICRKDDFFKLGNRGAQNVHSGDFN